MESPDGNKHNHHCDNCRTKENLQWYGRTNRIHCERQECLDFLDEEYRVMCEELEMKAMWEKEENG